MKIYKIAQEGTIMLYHVTTRAAADDIKRNGFSGHRIYFTPKNAVSFWVETLIEDKKYNSSDIVVIEFAVNRNFYDEEFYDWDKDQFSVGPTQTSYGEGKMGWNSPIERPKLVLNDNFKITRIIPWD